MVGSPPCGAGLRRTVFGRIIGRSPALSTRNQRLIPVYNRRSKENHEQRARAKKCAKGQLVVRVLALRRDDGDAEDTSEKRAGENREQRSLCAEKGSGHELHLPAPQAHPFAPAQLEVTLGDEP